jgi:hypothetical protein
MGTKTIKSQGVALNSIYINYLSWPYTLDNLLYPMQPVQSLTTIKILPNSFKEKTYIYKEKCGAKLKLFDGLTLQLIVFSLIMIAYFKP